MALQVGIIGLPNSGKSTIFNAVTRAGAAVAGYPFSTVDPNVGVVAVPDRRLERGAASAGCHEVIPADLRVVDIAGLVEGAHRGEGLGNQFLAHIREADALIHAVRCFSSPDVAHVRAEIDPVKDIAVVNAELMLADLATLQRRRDRIAKAAKSGDREKARELSLLEKLEEGLDREVPVRLQELSPGEEEILAGLFLLTAKPVVYVANLGEEQMGEDGGMLTAVRQVAEAVGYSPRYLGELVSTHLGHTLADHLLRLRIEESKRLLGGSDLSVHHVAEAVGYTDPAHFTRAFRRATGTTPKLFRRNARLL